MQMTKFRYSGFDYFTPDAGTTDSMICVACGEIMQVKRNIERRQHGRWFNCKGGEDCDHPVRRIDEFSCQYSGQGWHNQVIAIKRLQRDLPSQVLADLLNSEISEIIKNKVPTKNNWGFNF